jgi:glycosyltransferase involved in cell wall biosynthesis
LSHDCWLFPFLPQIRNKYPDVKFVGYFTVDGEPFNPRWAAIIYACDAILLPSQYGVHVMLDSCPDVLIKCAPYGISSDFTKRQVHGEELSLGNYQVTIPEFTVVYYGHNQNKKNIGNVLLAWNKFAREKTDCCLLLIVHTSTVKQGNKVLKQGYDLMLYTYVPNLLMLETIATDQQLSVLLSQCSSLIFPSLGEGFGLPVLEAMACGCIPITTNYAAVTDFCTPRNSILLDYVPFVGEKEVWRAVVSPDEILKALTQRYGIRGKPEEEILIQNGYKTASKYSWDQTAQTMLSVLEELKTHERNYYVAKY